MIEPAGKEGDFSVVRAAPVCNLTNETFEVVFEEPANTAFDVAYFLEENWKLLSPTMCSQQSR